MESRIERARRIFNEALQKAKETVRIANEELTRPLTQDDIRERDQENI